jgi:o-succinylbenzoate synthase
LKASYSKHLLKFKVPGGTSRGVLKTKESWFVMLRDGGNFGIGECGLLRGLSVDDTPDYVEKLRWACEHIDLGKEELYLALAAYPSIQFGLETAFLSLEASDPFQLFPSEFSSGVSGIPINGLIWMGDTDFMKKQIGLKLKEGFSCIKLKIGAIEFASEIALLKLIRKEYSASEVELRVDANGAFSPSEASEKLKKLSEFNIHSIEQPIAKGQWQEMANLCESSPIPIALDEELIGIFASEEKKKLLETVNPDYIILKPSLIGGFQGSDSWIDCASDLKIDWWITSALESNVGLNAISQYTFTKNSKLPQGLGTGNLYSNNIPSPLKIIEGKIYYITETEWDLSMFNLNI